MSRSPKSTNYSLSEEHVQLILRELETARKQAEERVAALRRQEKEQQKQVARDAAAAHQQQLGARIRTSTVSSKSTRRPMWRRPTSGSASNG